MTWKAIFCLCLAFSSLYAQFTDSNINPGFSLSEVAGTRVFTSLEGKSADPCNKYTTATYPDCQTIPDSAATILVPSASSPQTNTMVTQVIGGTRSVTIYGRNFPLAYSTLAQLSFVVGDPEKGCQTFNPLDVTPATSLINVLPAVFTPNTVSGITFVIPPGWATVERELEGKPRPLCIAHLGAPAVAATYYYTGFKIGVVWNCEIISGVSNCPPAPINTANKFLSGYQSLTFLQIQERSNRKTCCKSNLGSGFMNVGQCIFGPSDNALAPTACCGGAQIEIANEKCCNPLTDRTTFRTNPCPCSSSSTCPTDETCCLPTKYSEFKDLVTAGTLEGECVGTGYSCCNTGVRYNPGVQQCCPINGLQSANTPCPCATDDDCKNDANAVLMRCCTQVNNTVPLESAITCSAYANFPSGTAPYQIQRCPGSCFDTSYQICCNGVTCVKQYEKCCNNTCCNRWAETCQTQRRAGTSGNRYNWNDFGIKYEACTQIESLYPARAYFSLLHPIYCLVMSLISLSISLIFANKASARSFAAIEKAMIYVAVLTNIFDLILYFSGSWKYGLTILLIQNFTIITAATRVKQLNIWCLVLNVVLFIYVVDPFHGNQYLTLASSRTAFGQADRDSAGLIHMMGRMWKSRDEVAGAGAFCQWMFLGYFTLDPQLRDLDRFDNPARVAYGYCDRGFVLVQMVFCSAIYICVFLQLVLVLLALLLRFNKPKIAQE